MPDESDSPSDIEVIKQRKKEGIVIPLTRNVQAKESSTYLEYVKLIHNALPEIDYEVVKINQNFLNHNFKAPIIIDSMTVKNFKNWGMGIRRKYCSKISMDTLRMYGHLKTYMIIKNEIKFLKRSMRNHYFSGFF